jgi:hypothetical protein
MTMAAPITPAMNIVLPRQMPLADVTAINETIMIMMPLLERGKELAIAQNTAIPKNRKRRRGVCAVSDEANATAALIAELKGAQFALKALAPKASPRTRFAASKSVAVAPLRALKDVKNM